MPSIGDWMQCGTLGVTLNTTPETTVDSTFRIIEAFSAVVGVHGLSMSHEDNNITINTSGTYQIVSTSKFDGSNKTFEISLFKNGVDGGFTVSDRANGDSALSATLELVAGDVIDARQRSTDGGIALTITSMTITLERLR